MPRSADHFWHPTRRTLRRVRALAAASIHRLRRRPRAHSALLDDVRVRLEHYLRAMYGRAIRIESMSDAPPAVNWAHHTRRRMGLVRQSAASESDELCIRLPARLEDDGTGLHALERYRILAVQHAERMRRQTAVHGARAQSALERDLFLLAEAAAVDEALSATQPGLRSQLGQARTSALVARTMPRRLTALERHVETMIRAVLSNQPCGVGRGAVRDASASAAWAHATAAELEAEHHVGATRRYRGLPPIALWGTTLNARSSPAAPASITHQVRGVDAGGAQSKPKREATRHMLPSPSSSPDAQLPDADGHDAQESTDSPQEGQARESNAVSPHRMEGAIADMPLPSDETPGTELPDGRAHGAEGRPTPPGAMTYRYPEWDMSVGGFHSDGTVVRVVPAPTASPQWADDVLRDHMVLLRQARHQFEQLQSRRIRLVRQEQGDDLDLDACVRAIVDRHVGVTPEDRLYTVVRPGRRELAITLLIDISLSTSEIVFEQQRVIDLARLAALVASSALDTMGDDYSILAFSSDGAADVRVTMVKDFSDANSEIVRQRVSGLAPNGKTRLGAAIRHASAQLARHHATHRLLLILSDGKPNDRDRYFLDYGVEDSRRAVLDARAEGIHPYCITVDREEAAEYMSAIFCSSGYLTVQRPSQLPRALLGAVQRLLG